MPGHVIRHRDVTDRLIALAMLAAWAVGDMATAALLPIVMTFGHALEERSVLGSQEAIRALGRLTSGKVRRVKADGSIEEVPYDAVRAGDHIEVVAGARIPADGIVQHGDSSVGNGPITGESVPLDVEPGSTVFGGAMNLDGPLRIEVTLAGKQSTLGRIIELMQRAEQAKPPITQMLERYMGGYLCLVLLIAAIVWFVSANASAMLAVIVAACPCALVLAAPSTAIAGIAVGARHGILFRSAAFLDKFAQIDSLVIDKTGTLTYGELRVEDVMLEPGADAAQVLELAARRLAAQTGIAVVVAQALPHDKLDYVVREMAAGYHPLVVGDGLNDVLAIKAGPTSIAMGERGIDIAVASADVVLLGDDLRRIPTCVRLGRRCLHTAAVNAAIGLAWTVAVIALAATGVLSAVWVALLHNLGTFIVIANAGRLLRMDDNRRSEQP
jgi:cation transport ATPase